jgi:hypothetical protein
MDYGVFVKKFPSEVFLAKHFISLRQFKRRFLFVAYTRGLLRCGLSDVEIARLAEKGALVSLFGIPLLVPWKFDAEPYYRREVRTVGSTFTGLIAAIAGRVQDGLYPQGQFVIDAYGITVGEKKISYAECEAHIGVPADILAELFIEMRTILSHEPLEWKRIGRFESSGGVVHGTIDMRPPSRLPDPPDGWVKAKRIEREK